MAREQFNVSLPSEVKAMVSELCQTERGELSQTALIEKLIRDAYAKMQPQKRIDPIRDAKGRTTGWRAIYIDHTVGEFDLLDKAGAEKALDAYVYEELS